jgi:hypothetical protein
MKPWQLIDIWGRAAVLGATFLQIFFIIPLSNFDMSLFWFDSMDNQAAIARMLAHTDMSDDEKLRLAAEISKSTQTDNQYTDLTKFMKSTSSYGFAALFSLGSFMLLTARYLELKGENQRET